MKYYWPLYPVVLPNLLLCLLLVGFFRLLGKLGVAPLLTTMRFYRPLWGVLRVYAPGWCKLWGAGAQNWGVPLTFYRRLDYIRKTEHLPLTWHEVNHLTQGLVCNSCGLLVASSMAWAWGVWWLPLLGFATFWWLYVAGFVATFLVVLPYRLVVYWGAGWRVQLGSAYRLAYRYNWPEVLAYRAQARYEMRMSR